MKSLLINILVCPACLPRENRLSCRVIKKRGDDILSGFLQCGSCNARYAIEDGIAVLLPGPYSTDHNISSRYERLSLVSSYLWSHYADLFDDIDAGAAYRQWAELMEYNAGFSLDAGCAVGRFTFEMTEKSDFVIGIDYSHAFIRKARRLMIERQLKFSIPEEGSLTEDNTITLPEKWKMDRVEFIVADAQHPPFRADFFSSLASLNLIDKVPFPLMHLKEINRVAKKRKAQFLFSDPFSWSSDIAMKKDWLGGTSDGEYGGKGIDNISALLTGKKGGLLPPWKIGKEGHIWWKIRNHKNHFELIRSCFIKATR